MSISSNGFWRDVVVTATGAVIAVVLTFGVKAWLDCRAEKDLVCRIVANAYNENKHNIDIVTTPPEKGLLFSAELARLQISMDFIEELYRNVTVHRHLDRKYTMKYVPFMYKEYRRILISLKGSPVSEKQMKDNIDLLYSFEELLREIGRSIMSDKKWKEYSIPWIEVRKLIGRSIKGENFIFHKDRAE